MAEHRLDALLAGPVEEVAPRLLGAVLQHGDVAVRLTEVEAYAGADDPASHAARGRTPRNGVMFAAPGRLYCYLSHGVHVCANVSVEQEGTPAAVLLRAGEVVAGLTTARARRPRSTDRDLARGPGRLCRVLGIERGHDGIDLRDGAVRLVPGDAQVPGTVERGPRVGVRLEADRPWRWWLAGEPSVSPYRRHPAARR